MGIPHLITNLRPFASSTDLSGQDVVIDGPALAYHIYHLCLASQPRARNPFEATPSPALLGETALRWLGELQTNNVTLKKIFFDGFLPSSKRKTRSNRLANYTRQLSAYHQAWPQIIPNTSVVVGSPYTPVSIAVKLFDSTATPPSFPKLPATPFLVPSVLEALLGSKAYQDITEVVPGEADSYCAHYVRCHGGTVFTGDSDLLVHDLGSGAVTFLKDIEIIESRKGKSLNCVQYNVRTIAERLGLLSPHGIRSLAFEMIMDTHGSFRQLLQQATQTKAIILHEREFEEFSKEYIPLPEDLPSRSPRKQSDVHISSSLRQQLRELDPRISEYVLQFRIFAQAAHQPETAMSRGEPEIDMFLPFLLDCPIRTSAWAMSTPIRQLAYSLINQILAQDDRIAVVVEHRKVQSGTKGRDFQLPSMEEVPEACIGIVDLVKRLRERMPRATEPDIWRAVAFHQDAMLAYERDKISLGSSFMAHPAGPKLATFKVTWDSIHFSAELEGLYYSLRMLKQILGLVLSCGIHGLPPELHLLQRELETLPPLSSLPNPVDGMRKFSSDEDAATWTIVRQLFSVEEDRRTVLPPKEKKRRTKRKLKVATNDSARPQKKITNIFEHLASE